MSKAIERLDSILQPYLYQAKAIEDTDPHRAANIRTCAAAARKDLVELENLIITQFGGRGLFDEPILTTKDNP